MELQAIKEARQWGRAGNKCMWACKIRHVRQAWAGRQARAYKICVKGRQEGRHGKVGYGRQGHKGSSPKCLAKAGMACQVLHKKGRREGNL